MAIENSFLRVQFSSGNTLKINYVSIIMFLQNINLFDVLNLLLFLKITFEFKIVLIATFK